MNSKTLKKIRAAVRSMLAHLPVRGLDTPTVVRMVPDFTLPLNLNGTQKLRPMEFPLPAKNASRTQRAVYRRVKKQRRAGSAPSQAALSAI